MGNLNSGAALTLPRLWTSPMFSTHNIIMAEPITILSNITIFPNPSKYHRMFFDVFVFLVIVFKCPNSSFFLLKFMRDWTSPVLSSGLVVMIKDETIFTEVSILVCCCFHKTPLTTFIEVKSQHSS